LRYDDALRLADQAWHSGGSDPDQVRRIFALAGLAAGSIDDEEAARLWFRRWLFLQPTATLPDGTSPKLTALLDDARNALAGAVITAHIDAHSGALTVTVDADPLDLVVAVRAGATDVALSNHTTSVPAREVRSNIELVDRYGNILAIITVPPSATLVPAAAVSSPPPWFARWMTWAIVSGGLAAVGGGALWVTIDARSNITRLNEHSDMHQFSEVLPFEQRFRNARLVSGIAFTGAALAAITSTALWLRGRGEPNVELSTRGGSVVWTIAF
jgi:hypothetical protein